VTLRPTAESARVARHFVTDRFLADLPPCARDRPLLVVSEIVTNACCHTTSMIQLQVARQGGTLLVEVHDDDPAIPTMRQPSSGDVHGRGLFLVETLADDWGVIPTAPRGKTVWAQVPLSPLPGIPDQGASAPSGAVEQGTPP
jgi:hypothetical protein